MIRKTLPAVRAATFSVELPRADREWGIGPAGTGFFVSPDGWFVTAAHVLTKDSSPSGQPRDDLGRMLVIRPEDSRSGLTHLAFERPSPIAINRDTDFALLKFNLVGSQRLMEGVGEVEAFPFIQVSTRELEEGEPVYSYGFPLSELRDSWKSFEEAGVRVGSLRTRYASRVTSAIVAARNQAVGCGVGPDEPLRYAIDKALNYGNSGGPIVASETGSAFAICSEFQPLWVPQDHIGPQAAIFVPSLYGIVSSLANPWIIDRLTKEGVAVRSD